MERSRDFYVRITGDYALFTNPSTKGGGEKSSYSIPTRQALIGIVDAVYFKPTFQNVVTEVKIVKAIQTENIGTRALIGGVKADLNYISYLREVEYLVKFHFVWNNARKDLLHDQNLQKHEAIMTRSIDKGGRRDIFLGSRECLGFVEGIDKEEYQTIPSSYINQTLSFGIMFHSFEYPKKSGEPLKSYYTDTVMKNGIVRFKEQAECEIMNTLSNYTFKLPGEIKAVENELAEYEQMDRG